MQMQKESTCVKVFYNKVAGTQDCNFNQKRLQQRFSPVNFAKFLRIPCFTEHLQWLLLAVPCFQPATLSKKRLSQRYFSLNFAKFLQTSFDRAPPDDFFLCLSLNFGKFFRTPLL